MYSYKKIYSIKSCKAQKAEKNVYKIDLMTDLLCMVLELSSMELLQNCIGLYKMCYRKN